MFESTTCGRCAGSGSYSFNLMHGSVCYGCGGSGKKLTKRGSVAASYLRSLLMVPASTIAVGDLIEVTVINMGDMSAKGKFKRVTAIWRGPAIESGAYQVGHEQDETIVITVGESERCHYAPPSLVRKGFSKEEKAPMIERALAYQATLTKTGKVAKITA